MQRLLLMTCWWTYSGCTSSGGAAGWILMIAFLAIWLLILWFLWYSCSNDDDLVHGLLWWDFEPWMMISIFCAHTWMSWMLFNSEIRIDHAEFVTMVEIFCLHMLLHVKTWRSWWCWTTWMIAWHLCEDDVLERMYWCCKESEDLDTNVLMLQPLDDAWRYNYIVLSICIPGNYSNISESCWTLSLPHKGSVLVKM